MTGQELAAKLRDLGFSQVKSHMTALSEFEVLEQLSAPSKTPSQPNFKNISLVLIVNFKNFKIRAKMTKFMLFQK